MKIYRQTKCLFCVTCNMMIAKKVTFVNGSVYILLAYSSHGCIMYNKVHIIREVLNIFFQTNMDCPQELLKARRKWKKMILIIFFYLLQQGGIRKSRQKYIYILKQLLTKNKNIFPVIDSMKKLKLILSVFHFQ
jgi:hypothetical protein